MPKRTDIKSVLIIGAGPIVIGQACEFDYSGAQACKALKEEGYRVILVNSNPATIMTDPETADAILLYVGGRATFVVDAYTRRVLQRHFLCDSKADYETVRRLFHEALPPDVPLYNEYHALLVALGKRHCRTRARCDGCPLASMPHVDPRP